MARLAVLAVLASACSPYGGGAFNCGNDDQCGAGGKCFSGFCAFVDGACTSGYKYGELSGPQSNSCVASGGMGDGGTDGPLIDGPPGQPCYGTSLVRACFSTMPTGTVTFGTNTTIDTDTSTMCATLASPTPSPWCVIAGQTIQVQQGSTLKGRGSRPLVLVATGAITIAGTLDVASARGDMPGAGADAPGCNAGNAATNNGGGAGGSLGGNGGDAPILGGGTHGAALAPVSALRGGCRGQSGAGNNPGVGGHGGGATWLVAGTSIFVSGVINASGEGGDGGHTNASSGGGGGGSGGMVGLESPSTTVSGAVMANGGGGAEGSGSQSTGQNGNDPDPANPVTAAQGGQGGTSIGADGGDGAVSAMLNGMASASSCSAGCVSGGGGGGSAGIVKLVPNVPPQGGGSVTPPQS